MANQTVGSTQLTWLVLIYRVPTEPTRLRAAVWRRLRSLGAVYLQNSAAVVPRSAERERALRNLRNEIVEKMNGKAYLISAKTLAGEPDLISTFNAARDDEYEEVLDKCRDFLAGIQKEIDEEHYTYGELEENEEDLNKLRRWHLKVKARDALGASKAADVDVALEECSTALQGFASRVYDADADSH
ncbi:MAG: ChrB domain-containing protein [Actinomycetota bacterium]|nr:ChrB domain-containing protein [Actinomycetota bacterium]